MEIPGLGPIRATAEQKPTGLVATFVLGKDGAPAAAPAPSAAAPAEAPAAPPPPRRKLGGPTAEIDELFYAMVEMKASDLHMSVGSPPIVRHDGEIKPLAGRAVLTAADTERILLPIAPERNREEFKKRQRHRLRLRDPRARALPLQPLPRPQGRGRRLPRRSRARS